MFNSKAMNISVLENPITISDIDLEELEKRYLDYIVTALRGDLKRIVDGLNYRFQISDDLRNQFIQIKRKEEKQIFGLDISIERMFKFFFNKIFECYNPFPIELDLTYRLEEAIVHIEIKTTLITNPDYKGKIQLGRNQISYATSKFRPNLPTFYKSIRVPSLTYVIQIVHEHMQAKINALNVICVPNGRLFNHYGDSILNAGKGGWKKAKDIRYCYAKQPLFLLLTQRDRRDIFRIEILLLNRNMAIKDLTGKNLSLQPYRYIR